jgi:hypothetical protein
MNLATWEDAMLALDIFGDSEFIKSLENAPPGILNKKSWNFWHLWFELEAPALPVRKLGRV